MTELYSRPYRLEELIMMIQLCALGPFRRGNKALLDQLGEPRSISDGTWIELVRQHPGFFRVTGKVEGEEMISLALRYIDSPPHPPITLPVLELLMKEAVDLHEAEVSRIERADENEARRVERRNVLIAALIAGFSAIVANFIAALMNPK